MVSKYRIVVTLQKQIESSGICNVEQWGTISHQSLLESADPLGATQGFDAVVMFFSSLMRFAQQVNEICFPKPQRWAVTYKLVNDTANWSWSLAVVEGSSEDLRRLIAEKESCATSKIVIQEVVQV